jgi:ABC-2 type transport system permease protein
MSAELLKVKYLPFPRWTAAFLAGVVAIMGVALAIVEPTDPDKYVSIPNSSVGLVTALTAIVFGVWVSTLEFAAGTLQRTLIAEPDRRRVLTSKLVLVIVVAAAAGLLVATAAGGLSHLAANRAGVEIDDGDLAGDLFGSIPAWVSGAVIGYGFGLLARSLGGGIAASFVFVLAFDGLVSFIPGAQDYTYGQLSSDLTNHLSGSGDTQSALALAIIGTVAWCAVIVVPGWVRFTRGDLK